MLLHKSAVHDARVRREAGALALAGHEVTVVHLAGPVEGEALGDRGRGKLDGPADSGAAFALVSATLRRGRERLPHAIRLAIEAGRIAGSAFGTRPDVVHAHDAAMLLPGLAAARAAGAGLIYDSHELATGVPYRSESWARLVAVWERVGVPRADAVITVSDGIADRLRRRYRLRREPAVVRNVPDLPAPEAEAISGSAPVTDLRRELAIGEAPLVLHQGAVADGRGCETLVRAVATLDDAHLLFLGTEGATADWMREIARAVGAAERVHCQPPAPLESLLAHTAQADVGVSLLEDTCENHRLALPNKLFEYVAAGLPVVVSDLPEMGRLVRERGIGWCVDPGDEESVAVGLRLALNERADDGLQKQVLAAAAEFCWKHERKRLIEVYDRLEALEGRRTRPGSGRDA